MPHLLHPDHGKASLKQKGETLQFHHTEASTPAPLSWAGPLYHLRGELPEGVIITSVLTENGPEAFKIGMEMGLVIERFCIAVPDKATCSQ